MALYAHMKSGTLQLISVALKADETVSIRERQQYLAALRIGKPDTGNGVPANTNKPGILTYATAAARLGCAKRTIRKFCGEGLLVRHTYPGRKKAAGVTEQSVVTLIQGNPA